MLWFLTVNSQLLLGIQNSKLQSPINKFRGLYPFFFSQQSTINNRPLAKVTFARGGKGKG